MSALAAELTAWHVDARARTLALLDDLDDAQLLGPQLAIVNPPLWELGHVAWFHEHWAWRQARGGAPQRPDADALYDSAAVAHGTRWQLPLPTFAATRRYATAVHDALLSALAGGDPTPETAYFHRLGVLHEDMHGEAFAYTRQTLGYPAPPLALLPPPAAALLADGDARLPGGTVRIGAEPGDGFVFDNEKWAHDVHLAPFAMARTAVSNAAFAAFVDDGGYRDEAHWSPLGRAWRCAVGAAHPVYWRRAASGWEERRYDAWRPLRPDHPVLHVSWFEAEAYCRWAGRRLPREAEWEAAAAAELCADGSRYSGARRRYPWGSAPPAAAHANLDARRGDTIAVAALADGDSPAGCRQMLGNVWEWTADAFAPYPGFVVDPYRDYSAPWFATHMVLRGGCWATRARLIRATWRNFYTPDRRDVLAGFRTCAR